MTGQPEITVGLPVYNGEAWLRQSVPALLEQTHRDFTLIISDNASTDDTRAICEAYAQADSRIRYQRNPHNIGVFRNYERVFLESQSPYFKWASANDICGPDFLAQCLAALKANPSAVAAYPRTVLFTDDPGQGQDYVFDLEFADASPVLRFMRVLSDLRLNNAFNGVMRADALRQTSLNGVYRGSDIVLMAELALQGTIIQVPGRAFFRRVSPAAASALRDSRGLREFFASEGRDVLGTPTWDFYWHCFIGALSAPVPRRQRWQCAKHVLRRLWWTRQQLAREFWLRVSQPAANA